MLEIVFAFTMLVLVTMAAVAIWQVVKQHKAAMAQIVAIAERKQSEDKQEAA